MATLKKKDDILCLEIQLGDGDKRPTTRVFSRIEELDGTIVEPEFELLSTGDGSYTDETKKMPELDCIKVLYFIRKNATTPSNFYDPNFLSEVFMRDTIGELVKENLNVKISSIIKPSNTKTSIVYEKGISANIEEKKIIVEIEKKTITGVIDG
mgnify:CR=1 FL=1